MSDSRGRGLAERLRDSGLPDNPVIEEITRGGADIDKLLSHLQKSIERQSRDLICYRRTIVVVLGGICNLTYRHKEQHNNYISYQPASPVQAKQSLSDQYSCLREFCKSEKLEILLTTVYPAALKCAAQSFINQGKLSSLPFDDEEFQQQQKALEDDIEEINNALLDTAKQEGRQIINLQKLLISTSVKKRGRNRKIKKVSRYNYNHLPDGVHADHHLQTKIFTKIKNHLEYTLSKNQQLTLEENTSSQDSQEESQEEWDYKRRKSGGGGLRHPTPILS